MDKFYLCALALLLSLAAVPVFSTGEAPLNLKFAAPMPAPSVSVEELGLEAVYNSPVLIYHDAKTDRLSRQAASVLELMYRKAQGIVGIPLSVYGLVLVSDRKILPPKAREAHWLNVGGVPCLVRAPKEAALPFKDEFDAYLVFPFMVHESVDGGLKSALFKGSLTSATVTSRWWIEGIADYCATQACALFQKGACAYTRKGYLRALGQLGGAAAVDLESEKTWWPFSGALPHDVQHAYASANYVISAAAEKSGASWIRQTVERLRAEGAGKATSADFCRVAGEVISQDLRSAVRRVDVKAVEQFSRVIQ
ncbi:MAG: hypothetical protein HY921_07160 [Elusimicrobia bacterium]|nr:hypothetical protein [Elusimicrobiota bacterium]